jgi:hypothetical protein
VQLDRAEGHGEANAATPCLGCEIELKHFIPLCDWNPGAGIPDPNRTGISHALNFDRERATAFHRFYRIHGDVEQGLP